MRRFPGRHPGLSNLAEVRVEFHCFVYWFCVFHCGTQHSDRRGLAGDTGIAARPGWGLVPPQAAAVCLARPAPVPALTLRLAPNRCIPAPAFAQAAPGPGGRPLQVRNLPSSLLEPLGLPMPAGESVPSAALCRAAPALDPALRPLTPGPKAQKDRGTRNGPEGARPPTRHTPVAPGVHLTRWLCQPKCPCDPGSPDDQAAT